ncbi:MAG: hypothetical protein ACREH9_03215 [Pseudomonadota bacterium]
MSRAGDHSETGCRCSRDRDVKTMRPECSAANCRKRRDSHTLNKAARQSNACTQPASQQSAGTIMIRFLLRFIGLCMLASGFVFFVYDGTKSIANRQFIYMKVSDLWAIVNQNSLTLVQEWLREKALWAWSPYMQAFFNLPTWVVLASAAVILILLGRRKKPLIGYARN